MYIMYIIVICIRNTFCGLQYSLLDLFHHKYHKTRNRQVKISIWLKIMLLLEEIIKNNMYIYRYVYSCDKNSYKYTSRKD